MHSNSDELLGWLYPERKYIDKINKIAQNIRTRCEVFIVIGVGGSYLGAKAVIDIFNRPFSKNHPQVIFLGPDLNPDYLSDLLTYIENKKIMINLISKSGSTLETSLVFEFLISYLEKRYTQEKIKQMIIITTDEKKGPLRELVNEKGYASLPVPNNIGGRYSVLTPVGLLPIAVAGIDISELINGAVDMEQKLLNNDLQSNDCYKYACIRNLLYSKGKIVEILANYSSSMTNFGEWWKQLFAESQGKSHKGILPITVNYPGDLHSVGQYIQDGLRNMFQTVIYVKNPCCDLIINNKSFRKINEDIYKGVKLAHLEGGVVNLALELEKISPFVIGQLIYFFMKSCAVSSYLFNLNPFDQPGVDVYKKNVLKNLKAE